MHEPLDVDGSTVCAYDLADEAGCTAPGAYLIHAPGDDTCVDVPACREHALDLVDLNTAETGAGNTNGRVYLTAL